MNRRQALALLAAPVFAKRRPVLAITMDDVNWKSIPAPYTATAGSRILDALQAKTAALFPVGMFIDNEEGRKILRDWTRAGHILGNHTFSHKPLFQSTPEEFERDILRNEPFLTPYSRFQKRFRFPMLTEGRTKEVRDRVRLFLPEHSYRKSGGVTIDTSDWYYDARFRQPLQADSSFDATRFREPYLAHLWDRAQYYDQLPQTCLVRSVHHILLTHYTLLNALFLSGVIRMFESRGWSIVSAEEAFADPVFERKPDTIPAGESLLWAIAKESGKFPGRLRYPGEDGPYEKPVLDRLGL